MVRPIAGSPSPELGHDAVRGVPLLEYPWPDSPDAGLGQQRRLGLTDPEPDVTVTSDGREPEHVDEVAVDRFLDLPLPGVDGGEAAGQVFVIGPVLDAVEQILRGYPALLGAPARPVWASICSRAPANVQR